MRDNTFEGNNGGEEGTTAVTTACPKLESRSVQKEEKKKIHRNSAYEYQISATTKKHTRMRTSSTY